MQASRPAIFPSPSRGFPSPSRGLRHRVRPRPGVGPRFGIYLAIGVGLSGLLTPRPAIAETAPAPRDRLVIEPAALAQRLADGSADDWVILDVRDAEAYDSGHLPGAIRVEYDEWKSAFDPAQAAAWSERIGGLGIRHDSTVVLYDDSRQADAARVWWILRYWGVNDARLLNGGWPEWDASGRPTTDAASAPRPVAFEARAEPQRHTDKQDLLGRLGSEDLLIIDARSEAEHRGTEPLKNRRAGAIPGAIHLEWKDLVQEDSGRFKPAEELRQLFHDSGIDLGQPIVTYCQSGGRASVLAFGLERMGADAVSNYYAGWGEWGDSEETPIENEP